MTALRFFKLSLVLNIIGIGLPVFLYFDIYGIDSDLAEWIFYSFLASVIMFFWAKKYIKNNPLMKILERPNTVMDGSDIEKRMVVIILLFPVTFGAISIAAIGYFDDGLARTGWMLISMSVNIGMLLEGIHRLSHME